MPDSNEFDEVIDEGNESAQTVDDAAPADPAESAAFAPDSADETASEGSTAAKDGAEPTAEGEKDSEKGEGGTEAEKSDEELLAEVDKHLENPNHPKWLKHALKTTKSEFVRRTEALKQAFEPLTPYGEVPSIVERLELINKLDSVAVNPETNAPEPTVKPFVDAIVESRGPDAAVALMKELGNVASPFNDGWSLVHELIAAVGLDPTRLSDYQTFAQNGYQLAQSGGVPQPDPEDLAMVPENLREAFISLTPAKREQMFSLDPDTMELALTAVQRNLDDDRAARQAEERQASEQKEQAVQRQREFSESVVTRSNELVTESGETLFGGFVDSLVKADIAPLDAVMTANMMATVLNSTGAEGKQTLKALEAAGVKIDSSLTTLYTEWAQAAQHAAYFERMSAMEPKNQSHKDSHASNFNRFKELEQKLLIKSQPIIAAVVAHRANAAAAVTQKRNDLLDSTKKANNGLSAAAGRAAAVSTHIPSGRRGTENVPEFD